MEKRNYRRFTAEEKRTILEETRQPGVTLSEVCRRHSASPALVYQWRAVAQQATTVALQQVDSRGRSQPDAQTARLLAELERMRRVVAEITAENLELKKTLALQSHLYVAFAKSSTETRFLGFGLVATPRRRVSKLKRWMTLPC